MHAHFRRPPFFRILLLEFPSLMTFYCERTVKLSTVRNDLALIHLWRMVYLDFSIYWRGLYGKQ